MYVEFQQLIAFLQNKKILIAGFGREGKSSFDFIQQYAPSAQIVIADCVNLKVDLDGIPVRDGRDYLAFDDSFDLMLRSPGISMMDIPQDWILSGKLSSQTDLLLRFFSANVIGVTGTKGKSTATSLIFHILSTNGHRVILAGNMGLPFFDQIAQAENKWIVAELSSHQLETVKASPSVSVLLNIFPEHLDHYSSFDAYAAAKWNIARFQHQNDFLFLSRQLFAEAGSLLKELDCGQRIMFGCEKSKNSSFVAIVSEKLELQFGSVDAVVDCDWKKIPLRGVHNRVNIAAAVGASVTAGVTPENALDAVYSFQPLPHRLEWIGDIDGVGFVNDSISTIPQSTIAALDTFPETATLLLGGFDRGLDYTELVVYLKNHRVENIVLMGQVGIKLGEELETGMVAGSFFYAPNMQKAVEFAVQRTPKGKICLLSPAASSYDQYKNFEHRGDDFKHWAREFGAK